MQRKTRSILDELDSLLIHRDREHLIESRAMHIIQGAINLIENMREIYSPEEAADLERRLINSIKAQDSSKFSRGVTKLKENKNEDQ